MSWFSEYCIESGELTGRMFDLQSDANLMAHCADGCSMLLGEFDRRMHRVVDGTAIERDEMLEEDAAQLEFNARRQRGVLLAASDWVTLRALDTGTPVPLAWRQYRQFLRDAPSQSGWPRSVEWPTAPVDE